MKQPLGLVEMSCNRKLYLEIQSVTELPPPTPKTIVVMCLQALVGGVCAEESEDILAFWCIFHQME